MNSRYVWDVLFAFISANRVALKVYCKLQPMPFENKVFIIRTNI